MGAQKLSAEEALSFGLIDRIVAADALETEAQQLVSAMAQAPLETAQAIKKMCP